MFSRVLSLYVVLWLHIYSTFASPILESRQGGIDQTTYNNLVRFAKFSSTAYQLVCPRPLGTTLVKAIDQSGTQGYIARDDNRKEIVVTFRGTFSVADAVIDLYINFSPLQSPGITNAGSAQVHTGFLFAYNVVADEVIATVKSELAARSGYSVVVTGHSLGGAVASLAAISLRGAIPSNVGLKLYTYGQPRVGNEAFANLADQRLGLNNVFRATHTYDGVPTFLLKYLGYRHFGVEYWNYKDPSGPGTTRKCAAPGEDASCSDSIPSTFINPAHLVYFGQAMALNPLLCIFE